MNGENQIGRDTVKGKACTVGYSGVTSLFESTKAFYLAQINVIVI